MLLFPRLLLEFRPYHLRLDSLFSMPLCQRMVEYFLGDDFEIPGSRPGNICGFFFRFWGVLSGTDEPSPADKEAPRRWGPFISSLSSRCGVPVQVRPSLDRTFLFFRLLPSPFSRRPFPFIGGAVSSLRSPESPLLISPSSLEFSWF